MPMVMTMNGEQHSLSAAPLDLRTTHRERGSSSPDSSVTGSPAPPACTETDSLDQHVPVVKKESSAECKRAEHATLKLPFRKRKIPVEPETTGNGDRSPGTTQESEWTTGARVTVTAPSPRLWSPLPSYVPYYCLSPEPVGPVHQHTPHLLCTIALASRQDEDGDTPLHIAVVQGNMPVVYKLLQIFLLEHKSPDIYNNLRQTPLHLAVITQQANMLEALLKAGADPTALDRNGQTALHLCCEYDQPECLSLLLSLRSAAACLEIRNYDGMSSLHLAVLHGHKDLATILLNAGADINAMDNKSGQSPLMHAVESNNVNMAHFLIENGCDVNSQSYSRNTALHSACGRGQEDTVRLLLKNGADSGLKNYHNDTPVMVTTNKKIVDLIRGRSSKQMRVQDLHYISASPTHKSILADSGPPSPSQSRGSCSPPSTLSMSHQTHSLSPKMGTCFLSQPLTTSAHSPGNMYPPIRMDYEV
ncbi:B-cell lymphoma 3 protein homolog [Eucyclogobius newberryi]|uniref:B-cell lymphoma 3 protein homolog n=1 Tax=Eucyclogobius newberryi TaxID=166745 RepID=UPI003B58EB6E